MANKFTARALFYIFLLALIIYGGYIEGVGLHEPDTCFLCALGRWIVTHQAIPHTDPFSFTYSLVAAQHPFVVHQWLSDIVFYLVAQSGGALALILTAAVIVFAGNVGLPCLFMEQLALNRVLALALAILLMFASMLPAEVRPEIFTTLFLSVCLSLMAAVDREALILDREALKLDREALISGGTTAAPRLNKHAIVALAITTCLWANFHSAFLLSVCVLGLRLLCELAFLLGRRGGFQANPTWWLALPVAFLASLCNPYGLTLWLYLPHHFANNINPTINELQPFTLSQLANPAAWPFLIMGAFYLVTVVSRRRLLVLQPAYLFFALAGLAGIVATAKSMRMIAVSDLLLASALAGLNGSLLPTAAAEAKEAGSFRDKVSLALSAYWLPYSWLWQMKNAGLVLLGAILVSNAVKPQIPTATKAFAPPMGAATYLKTHAIRANLLNDPHFGDVLMWHLVDPPLLYIDSRYDVYSKELMDDYWVMTKCLPGWQSTLERYKIESVLLAPTAPLVAELGKHSDWDIVFSDSTCTLFVRNK